MAAAQGMELCYSHLSLPPSPVPSPIRVPPTLPMSFPTHSSRIAMWTTKLSWSRALPHAAGKGFGELLQQRSNTRNKETQEETQEQSLCPCGGGDHKLEYTQCCAPFHEGRAVEPDALSVLKARYSAYALGIVDYVVKTTHPENPDFEEKLAIHVEATCAGLKFIKLDVVNHESVGDHEAYVSFRAVYALKKGGKGERKVLEERSHFIRVGDNWLFKDGTALSQASQATRSTSSTPDFVEASVSRKGATGFKAKPKLRPRKV